MPCVDLLIIGGGSSGAALAYEAVRRGLKVTLLEAEDPAVGTSSRSTKLLHGGVRYLELAVKKADPAQFKLVREALVERGHWIRQAPFLAHTLNLVLPTEGLIERSYYRLGLGFYDLMAGSMADPLLETDSSAASSPGQRLSLSMLAAGMVLTIGRRSEYS